MGIINKVKTLGKVRTLGFGFVFETVFERIVPAWMFRYCSLEVYQMDLDKLPNDPFSTAAVKICDSAQELEQLAEITSEYTRNSKPQSVFWQKWMDKSQGGYGWQLATTKIVI